MTWTRRRYSGLLALAILAAAITSDVQPAQSAEVAPATVGLVDQSTGEWNLLDAAGQVGSFFYGDPGDLPFMGDWDCDGIDTPGLYRQSDGFAYLRNSNTQGNADIRFFFGNPSDLPLAGDFNGDGCDTLSLYRPSNQTFFFINALGLDGGSLGPAEFSYVFGNPSDKPFVGDLDGDGKDEVGLHRESTGLVYYRETLTTGIADKQFTFGDPGDRFVAGDWGIVDGVDTPAVFRPRDSAFYLRFSNSQGNADQSISFGEPDWLPVAGRFGELETSPIVPPGTLTVSILAVGQGDAAVYVGPCGATGVIDANRGKAGEVLAAIDALGTRSLTWISASHYDADHLGAVVDVATATGVNVNAVYDRGGDRSVKNTLTYRGYYDWVTGAGIRHPVDIGDVFTLCSGSQQVTFTVVSVGSDGTAAAGVPVSEENDRSVCLHVEYGDFDMATCGDASGTDTGSRSDVETAVAPSFGDVEVVKVNHHGSRFSSNPTYVATLSPEAAIISVGKNSFGHPDPTVVARWATAGDVYRTQDPVTGGPVDGNVTVTASASGAFSVSTSWSGKLVSYSADGAPGPGPTTTTTTIAAPACDPSYPTVCIPPPPPDLDCPEIPYRNFTVLAPDPHGFDGDQNGVGCQT